MERYKSFDYSKGIGILFIMFAHCIQYFTPMHEVNEWVCSFHVPVFFVISGCLCYKHFEKQLVFKDVVKKKFRTLLVPYIIFSLFNSALKLGVLVITHSLTNEKLNEELEDLLITGNGTVWFLVTLFFVDLVSFVCKKIQLNNYMYVILSVFCIIITYPIKTENPFLIVLLRVVSAFGYYSLGYLFQLAVDNGILKNVKMAYICITSLLINIIFFIIFDSDFSFFEGDFDNAFGSIVCSIFGAIAIISISNILEKTKSRNLIHLDEILDYFGKNSLTVMLVHPTILLIFTYTLDDYISKLNGITGVVMSLMLYTIIVLLEVPFVWLINKYFGWMIGKQKEKITA